MTTKLLNTLSVLSLVFAISLVHFEQGISLVILAFSLVFYGFCGFGSDSEAFPW